MGVIVGDDVVQDLELVDVVIEEVNLLLGLEVSNGLSFHPPGEYQCSGAFFISSTMQSP